MNLLTLFTPLVPLVGLVKLASQTKVNIDCLTQKLHYKITTGLFFLCSVILSTNDVFGINIYCFTNGLPVDEMNIYCWKKMTFTIASKYMMPPGPFGWIFRTMTFMVSKSSYQDVSNKGSNFILSLLEVGH